jgi:hypothetical protein
MTKIHLLLALAYPFLNLSAQTTPTITIDGGNAVDLCACEKPNIRVSVTAKNLGSGKAPAPVVVEAGIGNMRDNALVSNFRASWLYDATNIPIALNLEIVNPRLLRRAATYNVVVDALPDVAGSQKITLQVSHPAGSLQLPTKLIIVRKPGDHGAGDFRALEQSGKTDVTNLQAIALQPALLGNDPIAGTVDLGFPDFVPAGQTASVTYSLKGEFPLGTVTGSSQINSPQLAQPVTLNWEVRTASWVGLIVVYALLGSLLSWLLKTFLQAQIQLGEARVKADSLIARVEADLGKREDAKFRAAVQPPLDELKTVRNTSEPADIDTARNALDQAWRTALTTLATDRQTLISGIEDLKSVFEVAGTVPASLTAELTEAKSKMTSLDPLLTHDNISAGTHALTVIRTRLGNDLRMHGVEWQQRIARLLDALIQPGPGISAAIKQNFTPVVQDVKQRLGSIKNETAASTAQDISQLLSVVSTELGQARDPLELLKLKLDAELAEALQEMKDNNIGTRQNRDHLQRTMEAFAKGLPGAPDQPKEALNDLPGSLIAIDSAWRAALPHTPAVQQRLDAQDYLGAVNSAVAASAKGVLLRKSLQAAEGEDWTQSLHLITSAPPPVVSRQTIFGFALNAPDEPVEVRTRKQLLLDKSLQSFILFILVGAGGLSLYHSTFVGNLDDFFKIFFWAFGLDLTVDAVRTALKPKAAS